MGLREMAPYASTKQLVLQRLKQLLLKQLLLVLPLQQTSASTRRPVIAGEGKYGLHAAVVAVLSIAVG